jgi:hypothetical protein
MGQTPDAGLALLALGYVSIQYQRSIFFSQFSKKKRRLINIHLIYKSKLAAHTTFFCCVLLLFCQGPMQLSTKNITFYIDQSRNSPYYIAFQIWYHGGDEDITAVQLCEVDLAPLF